MTTDLTAQDAQAFAKKVKTIITVFGTIFILAGLTSSSKVLYDYYQATLSSGWVVTKGEIMVSEVKKRESLSHTSSGSQRRTSLFEPYIEYRYTVNGSDYTGNKIRFSAIASSLPRESFYYIKKYPAGKSINVYYDDSAPGKSVLEPGVVMKMNMAGLLGSLSFVVFGLIVIVMRDVYADPRYFVGDSYK